MTDKTDSQFEVEYNIYELDKGGYEYRVKLVDSNTGEVLDEWDSLHECYNGDGHISKENAKATIKQIENDIQDGNYGLWFDNVKVEYQT